MSSVNFNPVKTNDLLTVSSKSNQPLLDKIDQSNKLIAKNIDTKDQNIVNLKSPVNPVQAVNKFIDSSESFLGLNKKLDVPHKNVIGAYFNKIEFHESTDNKGISGIARLPDIKFDPSRYDKDVGQLDIPSVYMGGNANGKELDCGLSWDKVYDDSGNLTFTNSTQGTDGNDPAKRFVKTKDSEGNDIYKDFSNPAKIVAGKGTNVSLSDFEKTIKPNYAFRPFWRTTNDEKYQLSIGEKQKVNLSADKKKIKVGASDYSIQKKDNDLFYVGSDNKKHPIVMTKENGKDNYYIAANNWHNPNKDDSKNTKDSQNVYFYPGQNINMSIKTSKDNAVTMEINSTDGKTKFSQPFKADGFGEGGAQSFKAVNSIDQFTTVQKDGKKVRSGLEGLKSEVLPTSTQVNDAKWTLSVIKQNGSKEPLNDKNSVEFRGSDTLPEDFERSRSTSNGITTTELDIDPNEKDHKSIIDIKNKEIKTLENKIKVYCDQLVHGRKPEEIKAKFKKIEAELKRFSSAESSKSSDKVIEDILLNKIDITSEGKTRIETSFNSIPNKIISDFIKNLSAKYK